MQIKSATTGVTEVRGLQIQSSISHLLILKDGAAAITDEKITLVLKTNGGQNKSVIPLTKIRRPAVISQFGQGYQLIQADADSVNSAFLLSLSDFGAIQLENGDYLELDLTDLIALSSYSVYGIESPIKARAYNEYNTEVVTGSEPQIKTYSPELDCKGIALSNNGALASVRLSYANGNEVTYLPEELKAMMRQGNDVSFAPDSLVEGDSINQQLLGGGTEFFYLPLEGCYRFAVTTTGGTDLTLIQLIRRAF